MRATVVHKPVCRVASAASGAAKVNDGAIAIGHPIGASGNRIQGQGQVLTLAIFNPHMAVAEPRRRRCLGAPQATRSAAEPM